MVELYYTQAMAIFLWHLTRKLLVDQKFWCSNQIKDGNVADWVECFGEKHQEDTTINEAIHSTMVRFNRLDE